MRRLFLSVLSVGALFAAVLAMAGPAWAHVTVSAPGATQGGYAVLTFRVPTESATASTTKLQVKFPADTPIPSALVQPQPGWTFKTTTTKLAKPVTTDDGQVTEAISEIDWTADSAADAIKPGEFGQFQISAGPLPKVPKLLFSALQTYSDGSVVAWNQTAAPGSDVEPDHPKPSLTLAAVKSDGDSAAAAPASDGGGSDTGAIVLAAIALALAAGAFGVAVVTRARVKQ